MSKPLNIGLIGYGFMGRTHSNAYRQVPQFFDLEYHPVLKACCARNEENIKAFAENWGYESYETDWRRLIERDDIDVIDIGSPNNTHKEIALEAASLVGVDDLILTVGGTVSINKATDAAQVRGASTVM